MMSLEGAVLASPLVVTAPHSPSAWGGGVSSGAETNPCPPSRDPPSGPPSWARRSHTGPQENLRSLSPTAVQPFRHLSASIMELNPQPPTLMCVFFSAWGLNPRSQSFLHDVPSKDAFYPSINFRLPPRRRGRRRLSQRAAFTAFFWWRAG